MKPLNKLAFISEDFAPGLPSQQLLDRFLLGYPRDGDFHKVADCVVTAFCAQPEAEAALRQREQDHGLRVADSVTQTVGEADAVIVTRKGAGAEGNDELLEYALEHSRAGSRYFIYGTPGSSIDVTAAFYEQTVARDITFAAGTATTFAPFLPALQLPVGQVLKEALIVVQGVPLAAELDAISGLLPFIENRKGGDLGVRRARYLAGGALWQAGKAGEWSWKLLAAAISRSDNPLG
jgi:hypothetical protein